MNLKDAELWWGPIALEYGAELTRAVTSALGWKHVPLGSALATSCCAAGVIQFT